MSTLEPFLHAVYSRANCLHPQAFFVRLDSACNQRCGFCNILAPGVEFSLSAGYVRRMLRQIARLRDDATVNFTGGEPTLRRDLPALVRYAKQVGVGRVVLQTNAVRFASGAVLDALLEAGLDDALVSLHDHRPEVSDALTRAPGTWAKTVAGIETALARGLKITLNVVLTTQNAAALPDTVRFALARFPGLHGIILSPLQPHGDLLNHFELMPRYRDLVQPLRQAVPLIRDGGVNLYLSYCENPLCWLLEVFDTEGSIELRRTLSRRLHANGCHDCHLSTMMDKDKLKPPECAGCAFDGICYGVWTRYYEAFGGEELRAVPAPPGTRPVRHPVSVAPHRYPVDGAPAVAHVALKDTTLGRRWQGTLRRAGG